jgi:hypothetical protein
VPAWTRSPGAKDKGRFMVRVQPRVPRVGTKVYGAHKLTKKKKKFYLREILAMGRRKRLKINQIQKII